MIYKGKNILSNFFYCCLALIDRDQSFNVYTFNFRFTRRRISDIFTYRNDIIMIIVVVHVYLKLKQCLKEHPVKTKCQ